MGANFSNQGFGVERQMPVNDTKSFDWLQDFINRFNGHSRRITELEIQLGNLQRTYLMERPKACGCNAHTFKCISCNHRDYYEERGQDDKCQCFICQH